MGDDTGSLWMKKQRDPGPFGYRTIRVMTILQGMKQRPGNDTGRHTRPPGGLIARREHRDMAAGTGNSGVYRSYIAIGPAHARAHLIW